MSIPPSLPLRRTTLYSHFVLSCPLEHLRCHLRYDFAVIAVSEIALPTRQLEIQRDNKAGMDDRTSAPIPACGSGYCAVFTLTNAVGKPGAVETASPPNTRQRGSPAEA